MAETTSKSYSARLKTFDSFWSGYEAVAYQLAAIGHVSDRPPLEALELGSRCISCGAFVRQELSIKALGDTPGNASYKEDFQHFNFHDPGCLRLQVRIPLEPQALLPGIYGYRLDNLRNKWEKRIQAEQAPKPVERVSQRSSLFHLPTEIRLEIYAKVLPSLDAVTEITTLNRDSPRVITTQGYEKTGPRDLTKPSLLRTCRAVNEETLEMLYSHTAFNFASTKIMYLFLRAIGRSGRELIRAVDIVCGSREDAIAFALLASCERLRAITVRFARPVLMIPGPPLWMIEGMSCFLALSGLEEVAFGPCGTQFKCMTDEHPDSKIIREALTRPRETPADDTILSKYLNAS